MVILLHGSSKEKVAIHLRSNCLATFGCVWIVRRPKILSATDRWSVRNISIYLTLSRTPDLFRWLGQLTTTLFGGGTMARCDYLLCWIIMSSFDAMVLFIDSSLFSWSWWWCIVPRLLGLASVSSWHYHLVARNPSPPEQQQQHYIIILYIFDMDLRQAHNDML